MSSKTQEVRVADDQQTFNQIRAQEMVCDG